METAEFVGKKIAKKSGRPFKSGLKVNTVKTITQNPKNNNESAFTFEEDDSIVSACQCREAKLIRVGEIERLI